MRAIERLLSVFAPHECLGCGSEGSLLCSWCEPDACPVMPQQCYRCHSLSRENKVCSKCSRQSSLTHVWVRTEYDGIAKQLLYKLKFGRTASAAEPIGRMMADTLPYQGKSVVITHIPTATSRYRQRGYDQAALIAKQLARQKNIPYVPLLARLGQSRQVGSGRSQRLKQLKDAFRPINIPALKGADVIIVDDIVTTGASIESAARILKTNGAKRVNAALFAVKM